MNATRADSLGIDIDEIEKRLADNWSLPTRFYHHPAIFDFEMEAIFARSWAFFCPVQKVMEPGDVAVRQMGRWPIVVTRDRQGRLRAFFNVCRHRGYTVAERDQTRCLRLVCRYHTWSYNLDGSLAHAPDADGEAGFSKDDLGLRPVAVEQWGSAIFVNPDPEATPLREVWPEAFALGEANGLAQDPGEFELVRSVDYDIATNWKLWYDNGTECYHCPTIHETSFVDSYDAGVGTYASEMGPGFLMSHYWAKPRPGDNAQTPIDQYAFQVFPGFVCIGEGDILHLTGMVPMSAGRTRHVAHWLARPGTDPDFVKEWSDVWDQTYCEDNQATSDQYTNLASGLQPWNRYVASREFGSRHLSNTIWQHYKTALGAQ